MRLAGRFKIIVRTKSQMVAAGFCSLRRRGANLAHMLAGTVLTAKQVRLCGSKEKGVSLFIMC